MLGGKLTKSSYLKVRLGGLWDASCPRSVFGCEDVGCCFDLGVAIKVNSSNGAGSAAALSACGALLWAFLVSTEGSHPSIYGKMRLRGMQRRSMEIAMCED